MKKEAAKKPTKTAAYKLKDLVEANDCLREIGQLRRELESEGNALAGRVAKLKAELETKLLLRVKRIKTLESALKRYANANRDNLIVDGVKTIKLSSGEFGWRTSPARVVLGDEEGKVMTTLEKLGLGQYIRVIHELDRESLLRDRPAVAGISFAQNENFFLKPNEVIPEGERQIV